MKPGERDVSVALPGLFGHLVKAIWTRLRHVVNHLHPSVYINSLEGLWHEPEQLRRLGFSLWLGSCRSVNGAYISEKQNLTWNLKHVQTKNSTLRIQQFGLNFFSRARLNPLTQLFEVKRMALSAALARATGSPNLRS